MNRKQYRCPVCDETRLISVETVFAPSKTQPGKIEIVACEMCIPDIDAWKADCNAKGWETADWRRERRAEILRGIA